MMDATNSCVSIGGDFVRSLSERAMRERIPLSGSLELTARCNLNCAHCYLPLACRKRAPDAELGISRWLSLVDEIVDAGCLMLVITGGEPLLRPDFARIYTHARERGLLIALFSNGTLIDHELVELLTDLPPRGVDITLYGATRETYEQVTGIEGSFDRCIAGIEMLKAAGVPLRLKTILMTLNAHELLDMENMARNYDAPFRVDPGIFPRLDGDLSPLSLRVSPNEAAKWSFADEKRAESWVQLWDKAVPPPRNDRLYNCGAARIHFHITAQGLLQPCLMCQDVQHDLRTGTFMEGWVSVLPSILETHAPKDYDCDSCEIRTLCTHCPPFARLEHGDDRPNRFQCELAHRKHDFLRTRGKRQE